MQRPEVCNRQGLWKTLILTFQGRLHERGSTSKKIEESLFAGAGKRDREGSRRREKKKKEIDRLKVCGRQFLCATSTTSVEELSLPTAPEGGSRRNGRKKTCQGGHQRCIVNGRGSGPL